MSLTPDTWSSDWRGSSHNLDVLDSGRGCKVVIEDRRGSGHVSLLTLRVDYVSSWYRGPPQSTSSSVRESPSSKHPDPRFLYLFVKGFLL